MKVKIVSGGQTGVDQGALEAAKELGLEFGGWAPHGWMAENGTIPEEFRAAMREHPDMGSKANNYRERTKANVRDSEATLILTDALPVEGGTKLTRDVAVRLRRPHQVVAMGEPGAKEEARKWLLQFEGLETMVLNVAGPRESKAPGIQARTKAFVLSLLKP